MMTKLEKIYLLQRLDEYFKKHDFSCKKCDCIFNSREGRCRLFSGASGGKRCRRYVKGERL